VPSTPVTPRSGTRRNRSSASQPMPCTRRAPTSRLESVQGRVVELRGILGDEDQLIAEGKTIQAEALDRPPGRAARAWSSLRATRTKPL
jgi:hypothetical protein